MNTPREITVWEHEEMIKKFQAYVDENFNGNKAQAARYLGTSATFVGLVLDVTKKEIPNEKMLDAIGFERIRQSLFKKKAAA